MIKYDPTNWTKILFHPNTKGVFKNLWPSLLSFGIFSLGVSYLEIEVLEKFFPETLTIHSMLGFVLGLYLVFRTNTAYDRWWEGRKKWGALVNDSRNLAMKVKVMLPKSSHAKWQAMIASYPYALKDHLREITDPSILPNKEIWADDKINSVVHLPNYIAGNMQEDLHKLKKDGVVSEGDVFIMDKEIKSLTDVLGACERIRNTPIPFSYNMYLKKFIFLYIVTLPFGLVAKFEWWTAPVVMGFFYILVSTELIAEEIEDPFGLDPNDLPTDDLAKKIDANVQEIFER